MELTINEDILRKYIGTADEKAINNTLSIVFDACFEHPAIPPISRPVPAVTSELVRHIKLPADYAAKWPNKHDELAALFMEKLKLRFLAVDDKGQPLYDKQDLPAKMTKLTAVEFRAYVESCLLVRCPRSTINPDPWQLHTTPTGLELWWNRSFVDVAAKQNITAAIYSQYEIERVKFIAELRLMLQKKLQTNSSIELHRYDYIIDRVIDLMITGDQIVDYEEAPESMITELDKFIEEHTANITDQTAKSKQEDVIIDKFTIAFTTFCTWVGDGTIGQMYNEFQDRTALKIRRQLAKILPPPTGKPISAVKKYTITPN